MDVSDASQADDWWWIDYLENELDAALEADLQKLLAQSGRDRDNFENFRLLRQWLRESDPALGVHLDESVARVHAGVLAALEL